MDTHTQINNQYKNVFLKEKRQSVTRANVTLLNGMQMSSTLWRESRRVVARARGERDGSYWLIGIEYPFENLGTLFKCISVMTTPPNQCPQCCSAILKW